MVFWTRIQLTLGSLSFSGRSFSQHGLIAVHRVKWEFALIVAARRARRKKMAHEENWREQQISSSMAECIWCISSWAFKPGRRWPTSALPEEKILFFQWQRDEKVVSSLRWAMRRLTHLGDRGGCRSLKMIQSFLSSPMYFILSFSIPQSHLSPTGRPWSITEKKMSGMITKEELEEMREIFNKIGEWKVFFLSSLQFNRTLIMRAKYFLVTACWGCGLNHLFCCFVLLSVDLDSDGQICSYELKELLKNTGYCLPGFKIREIILKLDRNNDNTISFEEFLSVC